MAISRQHPRIVDCAVHPRNELAAPAGIKALKAAGKTQFHEAARVDAPKDLNGFFAGPGRLAKIHTLSWWWQIPLGASLALLGVLLRWVVAGALPPTGMPLITFYPGVALAGILGGLICGLSASFVSAFLAILLFFGTNPSTEVLSLGAFMFTSAIISGLGGMLHRSWVELGQVEGVQRETETLRLTHERLKLANAVAAIGTFDVDLSCLAIFNDDAVSDILGTPRGMSLDISTLKSLLSDDALVLLTEAIEQALSPNGGGRFRSEVNVRRASDGVERVVAAQAQVFFSNGLAIRLAGVCRDVTEERSAEREAAQRSMLTEQLTAVAGAAPGVIYSMKLGVDAWVSIPFVAPRVREVLGLEPAELVGDASAFLRRVHVEDFRDVESGMLAAAQSARRWSGVFRYKHPARGQIWIESHAMAAADPGGGAIWHGYLHDVSERVLAEQALRESEQRNAAFFKNANVGAAELGADLTYLRVNARFCEMAGYSEPQLLNMRAVDLSKPESRDSDEEALARHLNGERPRYSLETPLVRKDGTVIWAQVTGSLVQPDDGRPAYSVTLVLDVTERKLAEAALEKSRDYLLAMVEQAPVSIAMFDRNMNYLGASRRYIEEFGRGHTDLTSFNHYELNPDLPLRWKADHALSLSGEYLSNDNDYWKDSGGQEHWFRWTLSPWTNETGGIGGIILLIEDMGQQRRVEAALRESEERLRQIGDNLPESFVFRFVRDADGRAKLVHASAGIERILGLSPEEAIRDVDRIFRHFTAESRDRMREGEATSLLDFSDFQAECHFHRVAGDLGWAAVRWRPRRLPDGAVIYDGVCTDITRQKEVEAALEESENKFRTAFAASSVGFAMSAREGTIINVNAAFCKLTGYSGDELSRMTMLDFVHPEDRAENIALAARTHAAGSPAYVTEIRYLRRDNEVIWVRQSASLIRDNDGRTKWRINLVEDITERKRSEEVAIRTLARLRAVIDGAKDAIVVFDNQSLVQSINAAGRQMFRYSEVEIIGKPVSKLFPDQPETFFQSMLDPLCTTASPIEGAEVEGRRKDGSSFPLELSLVRTEFGDTPISIGFIKELSERRQIESKIEKLTAQRLAAMGGMAAALAHELNQPLATVGVYLETARHRIRTMEDHRLDSVRNALDRAMEQVLRAGNVVSHLREFILHGEPDKTHQNLHALVREVLRNFIHRTSAPIEVDLEFEAGNDEVLIDKSQIGHVLLSLLRNAQEATAGDSDARIRISTRIEGEDVRLTVTDNGPGVAADIHERLFEPLITSKPGGKGIGLSISKSIIEAHYGTITADNIDGGGAAFSFTLPLANAETVE